MKRAKRKWWFFVIGLALFIAALFSASLPGPGAWKAINIEGKIRRHAPIGSSVAQVDEFLTWQKIEHSNNPDGTGSITYAIIRWTRVGFPIYGDLQLVFLFDYRGRLTHYNIEPVFTGP